MAIAKPEETQGFTVQAGTGTVGTHVVSAIPHGSPHPADVAAGYAKPAGSNLQYRIRGGSGNVNEDSITTVKGLPPVWVQAPVITRVHGVAWSLVLGVQSALSMTFAITSGSLPTGVSLTASNGRLTATTATVVGSTTVTITATDAAGNAVPQSITLTFT